MVSADLHPSAADLEAFALGTLDDVALAAVEAHVTGCSACQERAAVAPGDAVIDLLRSPHARTGRKPDTVAEAAAQLYTTAPLTASPEAVTLTPAPTPAAPVEAVSADVLDAV